MLMGEILIGVGIAAVIIFAVLLGYLLRSRKRTRLYKKILLQETQAFEAFGTTVQLMRDASASGASASIHVGDSGQTDKTETENGGYRTGENYRAVPAETDATELGEDEDFLNSGSGGLDWGPLSGQYECIEEIKGGGMSRVFKARKLNTENEWLVKFIPRSIGKLTQEAEILKELNHVNLPSVIDIFESGEGQFLVESFIEGVGMDQVLKSHSNVPAFKLLDWAEQMAQVLSYLHNMPEPFLHLDLKPSNIMVTHDDRLVLIDFGISRRQSEVDGAAGATLSYAAPEQLKSKTAGRGKEIIEKRFGTLPEERADWALDVRTDIYSLGVILYEIAVGQIPRSGSLAVLKNYLPAALCEIIYKCIEVNPADRYQRVDELLAALQRQKQHTKTKIQFSLFARKAAGFATAAAAGLAAFGFIMGSRLIDVEARTIMTIDPSILTVSVLQSSEVRLNRFLPDTEESRPLNENNLSWEHSASGIAQVDGGRVIGLNVGETTVQGRYRHNSVTLRVQVVEPMHGIVEISQRYPAGNKVRRFAGTANRERLDASLPDAEFVAPGSIDTAENGAIYLVDSGVLRRIYNGMTETIEISPPFLVPRIVRTYGSDVFILTEAWQENEEGEEEFFYGIIRLAGAPSHKEAKGFFLGDALHTNIRDFVPANGLIYFIEWNAGLERAYLRTINMYNADDIQTLAEVPDGVSALAVGTTPQIFLADSQEGVLLSFNGEELSQLAGASGENAFIDGTAPLFYQPTRLRFGSNGLYVWDFNVLRLLRLENGIVAEAVTIAGAVSPTYDLEPPLREEPAERIILPHSQLADFTSTEDGILLTDPKRGLIWSVSYN